MKIKLLSLFLLIVSFSFGQYKSNTPWMEALKKTNTNQVSKSQSGASDAQIENHSIYELREAFDDYWKTSGKNPNVKGSGYKQFKRWENFWSNIVDQDGKLPTPKKLWDSFINKERGVGNTNPTSNWSSLGPNRPGVLSGSLPGTGRVNTVLVDPNNANIWYAGAPAGGIWRSDDAGEKWVGLFDDFPQIGVSGIAIDSSNSDIIYIATGDDDAGDSFSAGVFKSLDGGLTWNETGLNPGNSNIGLLMNEIYINPNNTDIVYVGSTQGLFRTIDGGDNWSLILSGNIDDFRLKPNDPDTIYAIANNDQYSKSTDGGNTFTSIVDILPTNAGRSVLEVTEDNPDALYILMAETFGNGGGFLGLFKSIDSGETFTASSNTTNIFEANQTFFNLTLEVAPTNEDMLFTGALNIWNSIDGGDNFNRVNQWFINNASYTHADIHFIRYFGDTLFVGSDGGLYVSNDNGVTFENRTGDMEITQFYRIDVADNTASRIAGGTQDNAGFVLTDGQWNVYTGGDGMDYEIDPNNPDLIYGFVQFGNVLFITNNAGQTVATVNAPSNNQGQQIQGNWITPLTITSDGTVYSGYDSVYRLDGANWTRVSSNLGNGNIEDIEAHPTDPNTLFVADNESILRSTDGGASFTEIAGFGSFISSFDINPNNPNIIYVTTSSRVGISQNGQQTTRGIFRLDISGVDPVVEDITLNIPDDQAFFSIVSQGRSTTNPVYVGTNLGVYRIDDTLTEWEEYFTGLPNTAVGDLEISLNDELLIAATYGRGIWQSPIPVEAADDDLSIVSITPSGNMIICGEIFPEITVKNNGINAINTVEVSYLVNDTSFNFTWEGTLNTNETTSIALPALDNSLFGPLNFEATATIANDAFTDNNTLSTSFIANRFANGGEVFDFESDASTLLSFNSDGSESLWERGVPNGTLLNAASSGTQAFATNLDGDHTDETTAFLVSGCYELSAIVAPVLSFQMAFDLEINFDVTFVEYSLNDGDSWSVLGNINSQPNWYNSDRTNASSGASNDCQNCPGAQWTGTEENFTEYAYDFVANAALGETDLTGEDNVIFRITFVSDFSVTQEGVVVDDFTVEGFQDDDDDDNDGILDVDDNCPLIGNASQLDTDSDGMGDVCDNDDDGDGILDVDDNCPLMANPNQEDADGDGIGDICDEDADNDGVPNDIDLCPDTPANAIVDTDGCAIFSLPTDNFTLLSTGESCETSNNGSIVITTTNAMNYTATLTDEDSVATSEAFQTDLSFTDLEAGTYTVCITVEGQDGFEQCFNLEVTQPDPLGVSSLVSDLDNLLTLELSGSTTYFIELNGESFVTTESEISLHLNKVENKLKVSTDLNCQGIFSETIVLSSEIFVYPNPNSSGILNIYLGSPDEFESTDIALFDTNGTSLLNKTYPVVNGYVTVNIEVLPAGVYILNLNTTNSLLSYKIIRR